MYLHSRCHHVPLSKPLPTSCQMGYVRHQDLHMATTTVREALNFSALLRQPKTTPKAEKLAYVEEIIKLLEMETYAEALVGEVGMGLNVEQRKRLTIGVELAAKPALLIFLDEPTSGLDSQSSWSIMMLLRKLADHGQAILVTIHQPSSELFQVFDRLLLLQEGGKTCFFGDIGENSKTLLEYFHARTDKRCEEQNNPAECASSISLNTVDMSKAITSLSPVYLLPSILTDLDQRLLVLEFYNKVFGSLIDPEQLHTALMTPSAGGAGDYNRLELLGDAFLKLVISVQVFVSHERTTHEGDLHPGSPTAARPTLQPVDTSAWNPSDNLMTPTGAPREPMGGILGGADDDMAYNPTWKHGVTFDVMNEKSVLQVQIYDRSIEEEMFLGFAEIRPKLVNNHVVDQW
ncbi:hypothetical protein JCM10207_008566 [Rhodosporidiobolus poonsookiae]